MKIKRLCKNCKALLKFSKKMQLAVATRVPSIAVLDELCRAIVRLRDKWTCRRCGRTKDQGWKIDWAHFITRGNKALRWDLDNSCLLCSYCHMDWAHKYPNEFKDWWKALIGPASFAALEMRSNGKGGDRGLIKLYLLQEGKKHGYGL